jgi:hypothetical protein
MCKKAEPKHNISVLQTHDASNKIYFSPLVILARACVRLKNRSTISLASTDMTQQTAQTGTHFIPNNTRITQSAAGWTGNAY